MNEFPAKQYRVAGRQRATIGGVPIFLGASVLVPMTFGSLSKLPQGILVALFTAAAIFVAIAAHEAAHAIVARRRGFHVDLVSIGAGAFCYCGGVTAAQLGVRVFIAGACANIACAAVFAAVLAILALDGHQRPFVEAAMQVNLVLGISNLMPAYSLDGGYIACLLIGRILPWRWALTIVGAVGLVVEALSWIAQLLLLIAGWPLVWGIGRSSLNLLDLANREPPREPNVQAQSQGERQVPSWLIRSSQHAEKRE